MSTQIEQGEFSEFARKNSKKGNLKVTSKLLKYLKELEEEKSNELNDLSSVSEDKSHCSSSS